MSCWHTLVRKSSVTSPDKILENVKPKSEYQEIQYKTNTISSICELLTSYSNHVQQFRDIINQTERAMSSSLNGSSCSLQLNQWEQPSPWPFPATNTVIYRSLQSAIKPMRANTKATIDYNSKLPKTEKVYE